MFPPRVDLSDYCLTSFLFFLIFWSTLVKYVSGQGVNTIMEESDPKIVYLPNGVDEVTWQTHNSSNFQNGTMYACKNVTSCTATVKFAGVSVYYYGALWPWNMSVILTLDNEPALIDLRDTTVPNSLQGVVGHAKSTQKSEIRWSRTGLTNQEHTLVISMDGATSQWAVVDRLVFTAANNSTTTASLSSISDASASPSSTPTPHPSSKIPLILGLAFGITGAILLSLLLFLILRKRRYQRTRTYRTSEGNTIVPVDHTHPTSMRDRPGLRSLMAQVTNQQRAAGSISPFTATGPVPVVTDSRSYATSRKRTMAETSASGPGSQSSSGNRNEGRAISGKREKTLRDATEEIRRSPPPSYYDSRS